jgi:hypothetical protein
VVGSGRGGGGPVDPIGTGAVTATVARALSSSSHHCSTVNRTAARRAVSATFAVLTVHSPLASSTHRVRSPEYSASHRT